MRRCHLDFESRSAADIWETGGWGYSTHPSTQVVCICFSVDNDPHIRTITKPTLEKQTWSREMGELLFLVSDPEVIFYAHNAFFEQCIWQNIMVPKHGMPPLPIHRWRCTAAKANAFGLPSSLQNAALALGITEQKDMTGKQTMLKLCKPRAPKKGEIVSGLLWYEDPEDYEILYEYCRQDVRVERALDDALPDLNPKEQEVWFLDQKINSRGVRVDIEFIGKARAALAVHQNRLEHELTALTGGKVTAGTQVGGIVRYLQERGVPITDLRAGTVSELIASGSLDEHCIRVLKYRQELSKTSNAKYDKLATAMDSYGVVRDCFQYHTATTGRWGGKLVQLHNLPVNRLGVDIFKAIEHVKEYDYNVLRFLYGTTVSQVLSACLRGVLIPRDGKEFYVVDYSAIEARGVFWLAGEQLGLYEFRESDEERGPEIYVRMAQRIFGNPHLTKKDKAERNLGKTAILGCGFGMGEARFVATCQAWGVKLPDSMWSRETNNYGEEVISCPIVPQYRETYPRVPEFWRAMQNTAIEAVNRPDTPIPCGHVQWYYHRAKDYLFMRLPSGRFLSYQAPRVGTGKFGGPELSYMTEVNNQWVRVSTYGGHLVENATQAAARDLMAYSMVELEKAGMPVMIHTHDEIVTENDIGANRLEEMIEIMCRVPEWAQGFPIKADGFVTRRYVKQ